MLFLLSLISPSYGQSHIFARVSESRMAKNKSFGGIVLYQYGKKKCQKIWEFLC